ncbi:hypothetical protein KFE26_23310 [Shewanella sp. M16]|uniref:hypothetical protein n=1 Tax=Shewanella TaxID=22 RepID=UPI001BAFB456|nr:hypothetical protein [Shewanella sp. M16]MBS0045176.1 hypothetical protein [Shewanella sp. M16]
MSADRYESSIKFTTNDGFLTIEDFQNVDNSFRLFAGGERIVIAFEASHVTIIDDTKNGTDIIELKIINNHPIYLKSSKEASEIAEFIGTEVFCYDESGNNLVPVSAFHFS